MGVVVPAILPVSRADLEGKLARLEGLVDAVQIDTVDGIYATPATWPYTESMRDFAHKVDQAEAIPHLGVFRYEVDLMVNNPEEVTGLWIAAGAQRLTIHVESTQKLSHIIHELGAKYGHAKGFAPGLLSLGLAIKNDTDLSVLDPYIADIDFVQFMGIATIGKQGQPFDERVLERIRTFRKAHPTMVIQVDGAVTKETAPALLEAGVDRLVVGHALWEAPNLEAELVHLRGLIHEHENFG